jgi:hypothetical protein
MGALEPVSPGDQFANWIILEETGRAGKDRVVRVRCMECADERSAFLKNVKRDKVACSCTSTHRPLGRLCACGCRQEIVGTRELQQYLNKAHAARAQYRRDRARGIKRRRDRDQVDVTQEHQPSV